MPGLVVNGQEVQIVGLNIVNFKDDPKYRLPSRDCGKRGGRTVHLIVVHSTKGIPSIPGHPGPENAAQVIKPGSGPQLASATTDSWSHSDRIGGAHLVVGQDGTIVCTCDLLLEEAFHAQSVNGESISIETSQGPDASFYEDQLAVIVPLLDALTWLFRIQRQFHGPYRPWHPPVRLQNHGGQGKDCYGIVGHRDQTDGRGPGDPGDWLAPRLREAGYEEFDFDKRTDIQTWQTRQAQLGFSAVECDGQPGPKTCDALLAQKGAALWIPRPVDGQVPAFDNLVTFTDEEAAALAAPSKLATFLGLQTATPAGDPLPDDVGGEADTVIERIKQTDDGTL